MFPDWIIDAPNPFDSVLVANRGEIAVRILRAAKESGLKGIAIFSDPDQNSLHVEISDQAIHLPGDNLSETYLNINAIISAAKKLTLTFDRWSGTDDELREWTLDNTSQMRGSEEGQEGLSSFLESRKPNWSSK